jgi:tetratricopeptide (TPR) repeat protein
VDGSMRVSMLFEANAAQARGEVASVRKELTGLSTDAIAAGRAGAASAEGTARAAQAQAEWGSIVQMARAELQPMVGEYYGLVAAIQQVATAEEMGALTAQEAARAQDLLARQANELMARMQAAGVTVDGTTAALQRHETAVQQLIAQNTGLSRATEGTIADTLRHGLALDGLRAKYNPLFAASRQYEQELRDIAEAERLGAISAMEATAARERAAQAMAPIPGQLGRVGASSQAAAAHMAQLGYQVNDIAMMMAAGQSPFLLMMQQGPQVAQVFGQMRLSGMAIGPAIAGAFGMMLNPVSLATLAIIGFGAAAVQWLGASAEAAATAEDAISRLADIRTGLAEAQRIEKMSLGELIEKYGTYALQIREAAKALKELRLAEAQDALNKGVSGANDDIGRYAARMDASDANRQYREAEGYALQGIAVDLPVGVEATRQAIESLQRDLNVTESEAIALANAFRSVNEASSFEDRLIAMQQLQAAMKAAGVSAADMPEPIRAALMETNEVTIAMGELRGQIEAGVTSLQSMVAAAPGGGWLSGAIGDAGTLAGKLWDAWSAAAAVAAAQDQLDQMKVEFSPGGQAMLKYGSREPGGTTSQNSLADRNKPKKVRGGGGGGAAADERDALADLIAEQERQIAALRDTDPVQREILKNHEALANATDAEREKVEGLITERLRLEQVRDRLQEIEQAGKSAFTGLITGSMSFSDALSNVLMKLADMAASDAWDILWGGGGGWAGLGGLISGWLGGGSSSGTGTLGLPMPFAEGGKVFGPGGPRDDAVAAWLSNGEFVMNAAATAANQPLLEALNAGVPISSLIHWIGGKHLAAMASGGFVDDSTGSSAPSGWRIGGGRIGRDQGGFGRMQLDISLVTRFDGKSGEFRSQVEEISRTVAADTTAEGLQIFRAHHLADAMAEIDAHPRVRG